MKMRMLLIAVSVFFAIALQGQDKFDVFQLTTDPTQDGFATWSADGSYIIYQHSGMSDTLGRNGLWKVRPDGSDPVQIFAGLAEHPKWSPDGRYVVFDADTGRSIKMIPAEGGEVIEILPDSVQIVNGGLPCWSPDGSCVAFHEGGTLSLCVVNIQTKHLTKIFREEGKVPLPACWTPDGNSVMIALMDRQTRQSTIWLVSSDGKEKKQVTGHHDNFYRHLALSPDGSLLVYAVREGRYMGLWIMPMTGEKSIPLAITQSAHNEGPAWSPDGKRIAFNSTRMGNHDIWIMDVDVESIRKELKQ